MSGTQIALTRPNGVSIQLRLDSKAAELLDDPDDERLAFSGSGATFPLWADCCQRRLTLVVPGVVEGRIVVRGQATCPGCGFPYKLRIKNANGNLGGYVVEKIDHVKAWEAWIAQRSITRRAVPLAKVASKRRRTLTLRKRDLAGHRGAHR